MSFLVVETVSEELELEISVVPSNWLTDDGCTVRWPSTTNPTRKARERAEPTKSWRTYQCNVLRSGFGMLNCSIVYVCVPR